MIRNTLQVFVFFPWACCRFSKTHRPRRSSPHFHFDRRNTARWVVIPDKRMSDMLRGVMSTPWNEQFALVVIAAGIGGFLLLRVLRR